MIEGVEYLGESSCNLAIARLSSHRQIAMEFSQENWARRGANGRVGASYRCRFQRRIIPSIGVDQGDEL